MRIIEKKINESWLKAAIVGSIWASFEIVFGSFLHNIKFPMSGTILTIIAISIMITFSLKWQEKGIILKAGIIAALMKSISPSAVLIGPMTGIFLEALIVEIVIQILGRNFFSYIFASILAVYSVLIHKIISLLIFYGFDIVRISKNLYYFIIKQLHIANLSFFQALLIISLLYVIAGIFAAITGIFIAKKSNKISSEYDEHFNLNFNSNFFEIDKNQKFNLILLLSNFIVIVSVFFIINKFNLIFSSIIAIFYIIFVGFRYKNSLRHLKKIGFWLQILLILIISTIFYNATNPKISIFDTEGLKAGCIMILRMFILVAGFSAISYEMRNPIVKIILFRRGMGNLYMSLGVAFSVLPVAIEHNTNPRKLLKNPSLIFSDMLKIAQNVFLFYKNEGLNRNVVIISGEKNQGKTSFLSNLASILKSNNFKIAGFLAIGIFDNNKNKSFFLHDINSDEKIFLASTNKFSNISVGRFYFNPKAFDFGEKIIENNLNYADIFFIDEIGHLELKNNGWSNIVENLFFNNKIQIWSVRNSLISDVINRFGLSKAFVFDVSNDSETDVMNLLSNLKKENA